MYRYEEEERQLEDKGWNIVDSHLLCDTPVKYQHYIQNSKAEFSCCKPSYVLFQNAWVSDRTICYLASGKPAIVQYTGKSDFLPMDQGIFRFRDIDDAIFYIEQVEKDYENQSKYARAIAEEYYDSNKVLKSLFEKIQ